MNARHATLVALLAVASVAGCSGTAWILTKTIGPFVPEEKVQAEYDLKGRSVVVLVDVKEPMLASEFPRLEVLLAEAIGKELAAHNACGPIVPAHRVEAARLAEPKFATWSIAEIGHYFDVDTVLHLELFEFRLRDTPSSNAYHGYAEAAVRLVSPEKGEQVWPALSAARVMTAETMPDVNPEQPTEQESVLIEGFAAKISRNFYTYKKADLPLRPKVK